MVIGYWLSRENQQFNSSTIQQFNNSTVQQLMIHNSTHFRYKKLSASRCTWLLSICLILSVAGCQHRNSTEHHEGDLSINRFEQLLFQTDRNDLPQKLTEVANIYNCHLLKIYPNDPQYMQMLQGFVSDPVVKEVYRITDSCYPTLYELEHNLTKALEKAAKLHPDIHCSKCFSLVTCDFDYNSRVTFEDGEMLISLDQYALPYFQKFGYFQTPLYIVAQCTPANILPDCMAAIARNHIALPSTEQPSLLDYMIMEGKVLYFIDQVLPDTPDSLKIRYTKEQMHWMESNEKMVWAYFVQNKVLYEDDYMRIHNFIDDAPKTNAFKDSAPRTTQYIGWQIVKAYMKKTHKSMKALFENANSQEILTQSCYRP